MAGRSQNLLHRRAVHCYDRTGIFGQARISIGTIIQLLLSSASDSLRSRRRPKEISTRHGRGHPAGTHPCARRIGNYRATPDVRTLHAMRNSSVALRIKTGEFCAVWVEGELGAA